MGTQGGRLAFQKRRIIEEIRDDFCFGTVLSIPLMFLKGVYDNPKGNRLAGGLQTARMYAPGITGCTTLVGGSFATIYYTMNYGRQKEDVWNRITSGVATVGLTSLGHQTLRSATRSALLPGPLFGLFFGTAMKVFDEESKEIKDN